MQAGTHLSRMHVFALQCSFWCADISSLFLQAAALKALVATPDADTPRDLAENLKRLFKYLEDASDDALSFANQAQQDAKRHRVPPDAATAEAAAQDAQEPATEDGQTVCFC